MQAQDYTGAKHAVALRSNTTDTEVERAITDGAIVRTWPLRGTLHFVAAADIRWILGLTAPGIIAGCARRYRELGLDEPTLAHSSILLAESLQGGVQRTRTELLAMLEQHGISTQGQRAPYLLQRASLDGHICQSVTQRNNPTYRALDEVAAHVPQIARAEALAMLALRYFTSHGPATLQDFVWWSGLPTRDARSGLEAVRAQLHAETLDAKVYWLNPAILTAPHDAAALHLLPGFDEYLLGYRDRSAVLDPQYWNQVVPGGNGVFMPMIVIGGRIAGVWKRVVKKDSVIITPAPFTAFGADEQAALAAAAQRYGDYLGMPIMLS